MAISYNVPITFGRNGTARELNCSGIDFSEDGTQSWTSAAMAELEVQLPPARQDIVLHIEASPFLVPDLISAQQLFVYMAGLFVGFCKLSGHEIRTFAVARGVISGRPIRMSLVMPNAMSPSMASLSEDRRELGIYLNTIVFKTSA